MGANYQTPSTTERRASRLAEQGLRLTNAFLKLKKTKDREQLIALAERLLAAQKATDLTSSAEYAQMLQRRSDLRQAVMTLMAANKLDAVLYPHQRRLVVPIGEEQVERNGVLSNSTGFPSHSGSRET